MNKCNHEALERITGTDGVNYEYCPTCNYSKQVPMTGEQIKAFIKYTLDCKSHDRNLSPAHYYLH